MPRNSQSTPGDAGRSRATSGIRVKWDRTIIALVALLALVTALVTGVAALFGAGTGLAAAISALVAVAGVASLRALALRDRKRRRDATIEQAFTEAVNPGRPTPGPDGPSGRGSSTVFDAASGRSEGPQAESEAPAPAPSAGTERPAGTETERTPSADTAVRASVPRPTYLDAPEAERPIPAPLVRPEVPAYQPGTKLKDGVSEEYLARVQATAHRALDLDKVLERRRAV